MQTAADASQDQVRVLLYSDDRNVRRDVRMALGTKLSDDLGALEYTECATQPAVISAMDAGEFDLLILDAEATPSGGMGIAHQLKDEIQHCPPIILLVAREQDAWLATWSRAEAISPFPVDPIRLPKLVADVLRMSPYVAPISTVRGLHDSGSADEDFSQ